jgi:hypothetical protein
VEGKLLATGTSQATGRAFNLVVALEPRGAIGRALIHSSFHHFADCNWDPRLPAPSFVSERPGNGILRERRAAEDIRRYAENAVRWLAGEDPGSGA